MTVYFAEASRPTVEKLTPKVHRGMEYLNEKFPGWGNVIFPPEVDMEWPERCMLGQLDEDGFNNYLGKNGLSAIWAEEHGFMIREWHNSSAKEEYRILTEMWRNEIEEIQRRKEQLD